MASPTLRVPQPLNDFRKFPTLHPMVPRADGQPGGSNVVLQSRGDGQFEYAIPTMVGGVDLLTIGPDEPFRVAIENGIENYPRFNSVPEVEAWIEANHGNINEDGSLGAPPFKNLLRKLLFQ